MHTTTKQVADDIYCVHNYAGLFFSAYLSRGDNKLDRMASTFVRYLFEHVVWVSFYFLMNILTLASVLCVFKSLLLDVLFSFQVKSNKMRRMESKKSHSWWWDSHISPKNSKWMQDNLERKLIHFNLILKSFHRNSCIMSWLD